MLLQFFFLWKTFAYLTHYFDFIGSRLQCIFFHTSYKLEYRIEHRNIQWVWIHREKWQHTFNYWYANFFFYRNYSRVRYDHQFMGEILNFKFPHTQRNKNKYVTRIFFLSLSVYLRWNSTFSPYVIKCIWFVCAKKKKNNKYVQTIESPIKQKLHRIQSPKSNLQNGFESMWNPTFWTIFPLLLWSFVYIESAIRLYLIDETIFCRFIKLSTLNVESFDFR